MNNEIVIEIESKPTKIKYKDIVWVPEHVVDKVDVNFTVPVEPKVGNVKKPYIVKWLEKKRSDDVFTLESFYHAYPKLQKDSAGRKRVEKIIGEMIMKGHLVQLGNDKFKVA